MGVSSCILLLGFGAEILAVEKQQGNDATTDGRISKIEDGAEEDEVFATYKGHPRGPVGLYQGEVEHVYHLAIEPGGIAFTGRYEAGKLVVGAFTEDGTVAHAVDDVAYSSGQDA